MAYERAFQTSRYERNLFCHSQCSLVPSVRHGWEWSSTALVTNEYLFFSACGDIEAQSSQKCKMNAMDSKELAVGRNCCMATQYVFHQVEEVQLH
jgi:hypothetical protein